MLVIYVFHGISSVFLARRNIVIDVIDSLVSPRILRGLA
jgi:TRAP-type C4-dicarboxylate transport system permease small subunit